MKQRKPEKYSLKYFHGLTDKKLSRRKNILNLTLLFEKYFDYAAYGSFFQEVELKPDIADLRKWFISKKKKTYIIESLQESMNGLEEGDGPIARWFLEYDMENQNNFATNVIPAGNWQYIKELPDNQAMSVVDSMTKKLNDNGPAGTSTEYMALFNRIHDYCSAQLNSKQKNGD